MSGRRWTTTGLPPSALCLEITENTLIDVTGSVRADLPALRTLGVRLAIDDFGVGYSSLSYLNRLPLDVLKIDRTFVEALPGDATLATAIVRLAEALHLDSIAEGVENEAQAQRAATHRLPLCARATSTPRQSPARTCPS